MSGKFCENLLGPIILSDFGKYQFSLELKIQQVTFNVFTADQKCVHGRWIGCL